MKDEIVCNSGGIMGWAERNIGRETTSLHGITIEDINKMVASLNKHRSKVMEFYLPAHDYPDMSDAAFRELAIQPGAKFVGGKEGIDRMLARCERLGIKTL